MDNYDLEFLSSAKWIPVLQNINCRTFNILQFLPFIIRRKRINKWFVSVKATAKLTFSLSESPLSAQFPHYD